MTNAYGKKIDTTYLDPETAASRLVLHRDMGAHNFRWSFVVKFLSEKSRYKTWNVLDVGCGRLVNLPRLLYHNMKTHTTGSYTGVDYGPIPWPESINKDTTKFNMTLHEKTDFVEWQPEGKVKLFDLITSFEMLEHVEPYHSYKTLRHMRELVKPGDAGWAIISTPNYSKKVGAAKNHVNEMTYAALEALIMAAGWEVNQVFGTFASQTDYKKGLSEQDRDVMARLEEYYDSTAISLIMAPLIPAHLARNCMWVLQPGNVDPGRLAAPEFKNPDHSNSEEWIKHRTKILKEISK